MEKIVYKNTIIAIRVRRLKNGALPLTDPTDPLQILTHKRKKGKYTKAHAHASKKRVTGKLQECLVMIKGEIKIDLYTPLGKFFKSIFLSAGQTVIFMDGGHAVRILEDCEFIEVKNGPFVEDKVFLEP